MTPEHYGATVGAATGVMPTAFQVPITVPSTVTAGSSFLLLVRQHRRGRRDLQPPDGHIALVWPGPGVRWNRVLIASRVCLEIYRTQMQVQGVNPTLT